MLARLRERSEAESGFTLIELLVVMIIIAILMAVAVPTFLSQKNTAIKTKATANIKQIVTAIESCSAQLPSGGYKDTAAGGLDCGLNTTLNGFEKTLTPMGITAAAPATPDKYQVALTADNQGFLVQTRILDSGNTVYFSEIHTADGQVWKHCGTAAMAVPASAAAAEPALTPVATSKTCKTGKW